MAPMLQNLFETSPLPQRRIVASIDQSIPDVVVAKPAKSFGKDVFDSIGSSLQYAESLGDFRYG